MKILYVIPYDWGGMPHYTAELANAVSRYAEVSIIGSEKIDSTYIFKNIKILRLFQEIRFSVGNLFGTISYKNILALFSFKALKQIDEVNPDVIHFTTPLIPPLPLFIILYRLSNRYPLIYTVHSMHQDTGIFMETIGKLNSFFAKVINFKWIIVHTESDKEELIAANAFEKEKIIVIHFGAYTIFTPRCSQGSKELISNSQDRYILFFGYIKQYKGLEYLLRAVELVFEELGDAKLIIAGQGDLSPYLGLINNSRPKIELYNEYISNDQVSTLFQKSTVVVLPYSQMTGQSGILNIASAFGKPVVTTDVGGFHEFVENGITGFIVPPRDPRALAEAILRIMNDKELEDKMSTSMRRKAEELSWDNIAKKHIEIYKKSITNK